MAQTMRLRARTFSGKVSDNDIRLLRVFCAVARCGGFAAAESELQLGLPSISRYIKDLETRLGVRLCRRGRVGFSLTDQGRIVYASSLQLIADLERFESKIRSIHSELSGTLNIGIIDSLLSDNSLSIPGILKNYKKQHPSVEFSILTTTSNVIEQQVLDRKLHVGFVIGRRHINQLEHRFLYREHSHLYCSELHPLYSKADVDIDDIFEHDFAGYTFLTETEQLGGRSFTQSAKVDSLEAVATLVCTGCFTGALPDHYVQSFWRLKKFRALLPDTFSYMTDIELIVRRDTSSPLALALLDQMDALEPGPAAKDKLPECANQLSKVARETGTREPEETPRVLVSRSDN